MKTAKQTLTIYQLVNTSETLKELADAIRLAGDKEGRIQGRTRTFDANKMASYCENYESMPKNTLTREYGIRQQALYILYFERKL